MFYRDTWAQINLDHFTHNLEVMSKHTKKDIFCVLKANAYGHGDLHIAQEAILYGCKYVAVSSLDEALSLRKKGFKADILILGYVQVKNISIAMQENITLSVVSSEWVNEIYTLNQDFKGLRVHLKIDTGMNRIGIKRIDECMSALDKLKIRGIEVEGIYTHYHSADKEDKETCRKQQNWFYHVLDSLDCNFKWIHTTNSDASISFKDERSNAIRVGLALYGVKNISTSLDLKLVLSLYTRITNCKEVMKNETIGYGATYTCLKNEIVATLPIGYGDGFTRANQGRFISIAEHAFEIIGRICMDQCMIKVDKMYPIGTKVEIIGEHISVEEMAKQLNTIPYEVLCLLNDRIPRVFLKNNEVVDTLNTRFHE